MKLLTILLLVLMASAGLMAQTAIAPAVGDGSQNNPWEIASLENLYWIAAGDDVVPTPDQSTRWASHYIQTTDIDASETSSWFAGEGWSSIGYWLNLEDNYPFTGSYNGQEHTIDALYINRPDTDFLGLWGFLDGAYIENLGVTNVDINGNFNIGGLVGEQSWSTISNSYSTGSVSGTWCIGGLVGSQTSDSTINNSYSTGSVSGYGIVGGLVGGQSGSTISNSYSTGSVSGALFVGGLVGARSSSTINNSYSTGIVSGDNYVGGLVGWNRNNSTISNSYSTGNVNGDYYVGGLVGVQDTSTITNSYSTGSVSGNSNVGGLAGSQVDSTTYNSYWNTDTSGQTTSYGGEGRTTAEMTYPYADNTYVGWDFIEIWAPDENYDFNDGYPYLREPVVSVEDDIIAVVEPARLSNFPNPFNPETRILFSIPRDVEKLDLKIYNIRGQLVRRLIPSTPYPAGEHQIVWDGLDERGRPAGSGIFFSRMSTPDYTETRKMLLLK